MGDGSWAAPIEWGNSTRCILRTMFFAVIHQTIMRLSTDAGARFVFRHNTVVNMHVDSHGTGSTARYRSVRQWEIYDNTFKADPPTPSNAIHMRGGTGWVFGNTSVGFGKFITLHTYRFHTGFQHWAGSDGTSGDLNDQRFM